MPRLPLVVLSAALSAVPLLAQQTPPAATQTPPPPATPPQQPPATPPVPDPNTPQTPPAGQQPPAGKQPPAGQQPPSPQGPVFRSEIELVSLNVTVTDGGKNFITDLSRDDFQVFEDGVRQEISYFTRTSTPLSLSLLIDTSASMETKIATAQQAAIGFVNKMRAEDQAQIVDFDSRVNILQTFTPDHNALQSAILRTAANGSTSLYNAIYIALKELRKIKVTSQEELRRQAIIVLSDGEDTSSLMPFEEVLELAKRSEVAIYTIGLRGKDAIGRGFNEADFVLRQFAQETGGRTFFPQTVAELGAIYEQINQELESQYQIAYSSRNPKRDGAWRRIVVRTTRPNAVARTKQGYYAPTN